MRGWRPRRRLEPVETPPDGIRATYQVTFTPSEVKRVRAAANEAGMTVCQYLRDLALHDTTVTCDQVVTGEKSVNDYRAARGFPPFPGPEVVVQIEASSLDKDALRRTVEQQLLRIGRGRA